MTQRLDKKIFDLKLAAKQITRSAKKLKKQEAKEIHMCLKHVMHGELEIGRVHAENAVRNRNQSLDLLTLGARLQGALNILQAATVQNAVTTAMRSVVSSMVAACSPRDMHLPSLSATMDRFERMTDHLGTRQTCVSQALGGMNATAGDAEQVNSLMAQIVDRAGLDVRSVMPAVECSTLQQINIPSSSSSSPPTPPPQNLQVSGLDEQLAKLRNFYG
ncbi:charged multivesicular body protein 1b-like [Aphis gossypii]|nr:charged multivesicular body protein 1b-like [Aphis gossypii]